MLDNEVLMKTAKGTGRVAATLVCVVAFAGATPTSAQAPQERPNVVYFLVDNLGMGELSVYSGGPRHS
jgi:hypothetical protein